MDALALLCSLHADGPSTLSPYELDTLFHGNALKVVFQMKKCSARIPQIYLSDYVHRSTRFSRLWPGK